MKKSFAAVLLCLVLLLMSAFPALAADNIDLSALTDAEIVDLLGRVTNELAARGLPKTAKLSKGAYIAGRDLPAGTYIFTVLAKGSDWGNVTVYSDGGKGKQLMWDVVAAPDEGEEPETLFIKLEEGDELKSGVPFSLTISTGILFQ